MARDLTKAPIWLVIPFVSLFIAVDVGMIAKGIQQLQLANTLETNSVTWDARVLDVWKAHKGGWQVRYTYRVKLLDGQPHDETKTVPVDADLAEQLKPGQVTKIHVSKEALEDSDLVGNTRTRGNAYPAIGIALGQLAIVGVVMFQYFRARRRKKQEFTLGRTSDEWTV